MSTNQKGYYNIDFSAIFIFFAVVGIVIGVFLTITVPWLWSLIKPLIHSLTA